MNRAIGLASRCKNAMPLVQRLDFGVATAAVELTAARGSFMNKPENEFAALVTRARLDDNQAFRVDRSVRADDPGAASVLLGKALRSSIDPTDLVQSVHLQLILALKEKKVAVGSPEQLRSLAVTLLRHKLIEHWRRHRCLARHHAAMAKRPGHLSGSISAALGEVDPSRTAEHQDLLEHLYRHLRAEDRRLIVMRLQGYPTREIAAELGISPDVLRVRLSRLRERLRKEKPLQEWV